MGSVKTARLLDLIKLRNQLPVYKVEKADMRYEVHVWPLSVGEEWVLAALIWVEVPTPNYSLYEKDIKYLAVGILPEYYRWADRQRAIRSLVRVCRRRSISSLFESLAPVADPVVASSNASVVASEVIVKGTEKRTLKELQDALASL